MHIPDWLHSLGLEQYAQLFAENGIDFDVLADLTEPDLESLGVLVGHRRKLLRAIATMSNMAVANNEPSAPESAERRQITLMFCDLVGSSSLAAQLDPEEMREIIRAYQHCYTTIIARYDGFIAQFTGDGMLVYFGYPVAHEDDAERAVRASLDIVAAITGLKTLADDRLQVRIGIATGLVIVGDLLGRGSARERAVIGDTPKFGCQVAGAGRSGRHRRVRRDTTVAGRPVHPARTWQLPGEGFPRTGGGLGGRGCIRV